MGMASGSRWNIWVWLLGVVVRRYKIIDFLILLIPTPLFFFTAASLLFVHLKKNIYIHCPAVHLPGFYPGHTASLLNNMDNVVATVRAQLKVISATVRDSVLQEAANHQSVMLAI